MYRMLISAVRTMHLKMIQFTKISYTGTTMAIAWLMNNL